MWFEDSVVLRCAFPRLVGRPERGCLVIGEVAQAHDGSLGMAHAYVDAIARAGADAVKFQTHIAAAESTLSEPWRVQFSRQDATRYDYWRRMEFTEEQWLGLKRHAEDVKLWFLSSPFSIEAVNLLERIGVAAWKVASGETSNTLLFERLAESPLPILLSTGMSSFSEIDVAVAALRRVERTLCVMQCTSAYPCPPEKVGLNVLEELRKRYQCPVGLSDHSGTVFAGLAATVLGISALELHVTMSREMFGPDVSASVTTEELRTLVAGVRFVEDALAHPVDKDHLAEESADLRRLFNKSVVAAVDLATGTVLEARHLGIKKPGTGIPADRLGSLLGRRLKRSVKRDTLLSEEDLEVSR